jgi:O-antigen biosynthesis protein
MTTKRSSGKTKVSHKGKKTANAVLHQLSSELIAFCNPELDNFFIAPTLPNKPSRWWTHVPFAFWLIAKTKPRLFVELGTQYGVSYAAFCEAVIREKTPTRCYAVDTWLGDDQAGYNGDNVYQDLRSLNHQRYGSFSTLIRSSFEDALATIADGSVDLLHIDGRHSYEDVREDFESWLPKLSERAVVLFHDTNMTQPDFGVKRYFAELCEQYPSFEFLHGSGLGMLVVGSSVPSEVAAICSQKDSNTVNRLRTRFSQTGEQWYAPYKENLIRNEIMNENRSLFNKREAELRNQLQAELTEKHRTHEFVQQQKLEELENRLSEQETAFRTAMIAASAPTKNRVSGRFPAWATQLGPLSGSWSQEYFNSDVVRRSPLFNAKWYITNYPDVARSGIDPAKHYFRFGRSEGRDPGPLFSTSEYLLANSDVRESKLNPLVHFELYGRCEGRTNWLRKSDSANDSIAGYPDESWRNALPLIERHITGFVQRPVIAIAMPVYNPHPPYLEAAIKSVQAQIYSYWELCIANDASTDPEIANILDRYAAHDARIKVVHRKTNGHISAATNSALELVTSDFVALMDHDDLLHPTALYEIANLLQNSGDVDVIYSDEDYIDGKGHRRPGYFKPDFNIELLLGQNMVNHLGVYRMSILREIGGLRVGFEGSQDYDLILRVLTKSAASRVKHIPVVLYHWRRDGRQQSFSEKHLQKCQDAARRAIQDYLAFEGEGAVVEVSPDIEHYSRVRRRLPDPMPLVSCIIPTRNRHKLLNACVEGLLHKTDYQNFEIIIINNDSDEPETLDLFKMFTASDPRIRILHQPGPFNYSALNNAAVREAKGSILALLNNDLEMIDPAWLSEMVSLAVRKEIGAVGAKLFYPSGKIQHAGVLVGALGTAGHSWHGFPKDTIGYFANAILTRQVSAVTAACLLVEKQKFLEAGGFDAVNLTVAYNDVDFCLRLMEKGYRNIWTPFAKLIHHESVSRGKEDTILKQLRSKREVAYFQKRWAEMIANDPFYNPNLTLEHSDFRLAEQSRKKWPWVDFGLTKG